MGDDTTAGAIPAPVIDVAPDRTSRRWPAILLSLLEPGLGHLAIGHPRRMVAWFSTLAGITALTVVGALRGAPVTMLATLGAAVILRLGAAVDTVRLERPRPLPRPGVVLLMVVGFFAFWTILQMRVRASVIEAFRVPMGSMYPTVEAGDHLFATKLDTRYGRGDVIVFRYPLDPETQYLKRIVAVAGDTIETRDGQLILNGQAVPRTLTSRPCAIPDNGDHAPGACTIWEEELDGHTYAVAHEQEPPRDTPPVRVPEGAVFVLGDNRENSSDSRVWGTVGHDLIVGKVTGIWWSSGRDGIRWDRLNLRIR